jgi:hypothetical protein
MKQYKALETAQAKVRAKAAAQKSGTSTDKKTAKEKKAMEYAKAREAIVNKKKQEAEVLKYVAHEVISDAINTRWSYWIQVYIKQGCKPNKAIDIALAAAIFEAVAKIEAVNIHKRVYCLLEQIKQIVAQNNVKYLPKNPRRIKDKIDLFKSGLTIEQIIKLPRQGNENRKGYKVSKGGKVVQSRQIKDTFIEQCF